MPPASAMGEEQGGAQDVPTAALIGATGAGKSSTGNSLFGCCGEASAFAVEAATMASVTTETTVALRPWRGGACGKKVRIVDSPGLGDSEGRDTEHISGLADVLKSSVRYVHAFLIVFNSQEPRLNSSLKEMLTIFKDMFGEGFLRHVVIVFTRWEYDKRSRRKREKNGITCSQRATMMNEELRRVLGHDFDCPCVFLDNSLNDCTDEELDDLYDDEVEPMMREFEDEMEKVFAFMQHTRPFLCQDVKAAMSEKEKLKHKVLQLIELVNEDALGRNIISAEQGVIHRGWIRWRRRWVWGVLRRQHLRVFFDETSNELTGPREVDLTGCVCSEGSEWQRLRKFPSFTVYRPVNVQGTTRSYFCHVFQVRTEQERQQWVLLVQEATQLSESWHRIEKFYEGLRVAPTRTEYEKAIGIVNHETMVIPVEWVLQQVDSKNRVPSLHQAGKDLQRDRVVVDGVSFVNPSCDELAAHVCARLLEGAGRPQDDRAEVKAAVIARDVLLSCSRTQGGGDTFDAVHLLFGSNEHDLVLCRPDAPTEPILVRLLCRSGDDAGGDVLRTLAPDTGVPQFQRDSSAAHLSTEVVRSMDLTREQHICTTTVDADAWVPDWQMVQCMRCGERFNPFLRRHHCRACGALVCYSCSRHFVPVGDDGAASPESFGESSSAHRERVCFLCYQRAVIKDLDARKQRGLQAVLNEEELSCLAGSASESGNTLADEGEQEPVDAVESECSSCAYQPPDADEARPPEEEEWPAVSIEMESRYKIMPMDIARPEEWFTLDCKYVRVVRWSGLADEGRVFISVSTTAGHQAGLAADASAG